MTTSSDISYYIGLLSCFVVGMVAYNVGYIQAREMFKVTTEYKCHEDIVYKWTGSYWDKIGQGCKTEEQMKKYL